MSNVVFPEPRKPVIIVTGICSCSFELSFAPDKFKLISYLFFGTRDTFNSVIDELPILALAACFAKGQTQIKDASSLRVKETDRITTTTTELTRMGAQIKETTDGMIVTGIKSLYGTTTSSHGDHRLAMTLGIAGMLADGETEIAYPGSTRISYPGFWDDLKVIAPGILDSNAN